MLVNSCDLLRTSQEPLIMSPMSAGVLLTATADSAVRPTLPAKYMYVEWILSFTYCGQILQKTHSFSFHQEQSASARTETRVNDSKRSSLLIRSFLIMRSVLGFMSFRSRLHNTDHN